MTKTGDVSAYQPAATARPIDRELGDPAGHFGRMNFASTAIPASRAPAPDGLARARSGVLGRAMTKSASLDPATKLERAKQRLYVLCQAGGWGIFLVLQLAYVFWLSPKSTSTTDEKLFAASSIVTAIALGLLLTHYGRGYMHRRGWKELGWRALSPRIFAISFVQSLLWSLIGFAWPYLILGHDWTSKVPLLVVTLISVVNGLILLIGWHSLYYFYHLFDRLNRMQVEQFRLAANVKEAELRALKSQVNPHFLFNSLNSLRALIEEDAPRAREAVTRLANMLRYSLQSGQQETVPLEEEVRIVEDYLALEMIRHENRLRVRWNVTDEARGHAVPPMLLQTLVENAVKYGISPRREGGEIMIGAAVEAEDLHIRVSNPGDLSAPPSVAAAKAGSSTGVGLRNASERLQLLFGDRARLNLATEPIGCVTAHVRIPLGPSPKTAR